MATDPRLARATARIATPPQPPPPPPPMSQMKVTGGYDGTDEVAASKLEGKEEGGYKLKFCTVCASNQNRYVLGSSARYARLVDVFRTHERASKNGHWLYLYPATGTSTLSSSCKLLKMFYQIYGSPSTPFISLLPSHLLWNRISCSPSWTINHSAQRLSLQ